MKKLMTGLLAIGLLLGYGLDPAFAAGGKNRGTKGKGATQTKRLQTGKTAPPKNQAKKQDGSCKK